MFSTLNDFISYFLTSAQRSAEVRALQRALSFYISIFRGMYVCSLWSTLH